MRVCVIAIFLHYFNKNSPTDAIYFTEHIDMHSMCIILKKSFIYLKLNGFDVDPAAVVVAVMVLVGPAAVVLYFQAKL